MGTSNPQKIGKYEVVELIGRGGMGLVYKAIDPAIGRPVAIKLMTAALGADPELLKRFHREAQSAGNLQHPNILTVYELGDFGDNPYLVLEFIEGESLDRIITSRREMLLEEKLGLVIQICNGLHYAHERHIIHRDIKPGNIMVATGGTVKIVDFGLARMGKDNLTLPGQVMGSVNYMSPEQINGQPVDHRTDIFATGVVLYQLLAYALPFQGTDTGSTLLKIIHEPPLPLQTFLKGYPPELDGIIQRVLAKDRNARYPNAEDLAVDLIQIRDQLRREKIARYLQDIQTLMAASELEKAQEQLSQVLKMDRQHPGANELMREVRQRIQKQLAEQRAQELRSQAEVALRQQNFDQALVCLGDAVKLDDSNTELVHFRDFVQETKTRTERVREALQRAESAQTADELEDALKSVEEALALDPNCVDATAMQAAIRNAIAERDKRKQFEALTAQAREQIAAREFQKALETLKKAEAMDAAAPVIGELTRLADAGLEHERRRQEIAKLVSAIEDALHRDDYNTACARADEGLRLFGDDRRLQQLKTLADKQREAGERRAYITEQISTARKLLESEKTAEALGVVKTASQKYPAEPALLSMLTMVKETLAREESERQKTEYMQKAKELLRRKQYSEAIQLLESARECLKTIDFDDLIQFARDEAANYARREQIAEAAGQANRLIASEEYERAVEFLQAKLAELPDDELQIILAGAQRHIAEFTRSVAEAVRSAQRLVSQHRASEAVQQLESQPRSFTKSRDFTVTLEKARLELKNQQVIATAKEQVSVSLAKEDFERAAAIVEDCRRELGDVTDVLLLAGQVDAKRTETFTRRVEGAIRDARTLLLGRSHRSAQEILDTVSDYAEAVPAELKMQYESLRARAAGGIARQESRAELRQPPPPEKGYAPGSDPTLPQTHWSGAVTPVLPLLPPPAPPPLPPQQVQEVDIGGQGDSSTTRHGDSSTFHGIGHVIPIAPAEIDAIQDRTAPPELAAQAQAPSVEEAPPSQAPGPRLEPSAPRVSETAVEQARLAEADTSAAGPVPSASAVAPEMPEAIRPQTTAAEPEPISREAPLPPLLTPIAAPRERHVPPKSPLSGDFMRRLRGREIAAIAIAAAIILTIVVARQIFHTTPENTVLVPVVTTPDGATVRVNSKDSCVTPKCQIKLGPGTHEIQVGKPGYETVTRNLTIKSTAESLEPIRLGLRPLKQVLQVSTNFQSGRVSLDNKQVASLQDGQFLMEDLPPGPHVLGVIGPDAEANLMFEAAPGQLATIRSAPEAKQAQAVIVSSLGNGLHVACNCSENVSLDGKMVGKLGPDGLSVNDVSPGTHSLNVGEGGNQYAFTVSTGQAPALDIFLASNRNVGTLVVETKEDGVAILLDGKKYVRTTANGLVRIPLDVKNYRVQVEKRGYRAPPPKQAQIRRNEDTRLVFKLEPEAASLIMRGAPANAQISIDGHPVGIVSPTGTFSAKIGPGEHLIEAAKSGYTPRLLRRTFNPGETVTLSKGELQLRETQWSAETPAPQVRVPETRPPEITTAAPPPSVTGPSQDWERISATRDVAVLESFRKKYPDSPFAEQAAKRIEQLDWESVKNAREPGPLEAFLRKYPNSSYSQAARNALSSLEKEQIGSDRQAILEALQRYALAYQHKDAAELATIWPTLGKQDLKKIKDSFRNALSVRMDLRAMSDPQIAGDRATVTCSRSLQWTFKEGAANPQQDTVTVELRKKGGFWAMESIH